MRTVWLIYDLSFIARGAPFTLLKTLKDSCTIHQVISKNTINELSSHSAPSHASGQDDGKSLGLMNDIVKSPDFTPNVASKDGLLLPPPPPPTLAVQSHKLSVSVKLAFEIDKSNHGDLIIIAADDPKIKDEIAEGKLDLRNIFYASNDQDLLSCLNKPENRYHADGGSEKCEFKDGLRHGKQLIYDKSGLLVREITWEKGCPLNIIEYDDKGLKHGRETIFFPHSQIIQLELIWKNGALLVETNFNLEGQKHGGERHFATDGKILKELNWDNGRLVTAKEEAKGHAPPAGKPVDHAKPLLKPVAKPILKPILKPASKPIKPATARDKIPLEAALASAKKENIFYPGSEFVQKELLLVDGEVAAEIPYNLNGKKHGKELVYFPGTTKVRDERHWDNGWLHSEARYNEDGEKDGKETDYHPNSTKPRLVKTWVKSILNSMVSFNLRGQRDGKEILCFINDGHKREERIWGNDRLLCKIICDKEGRKEGPELVFSPDDGRITRKITWLNNFIIENVNYNEAGRKHGKEQQFLNMGLKEIIWEDGHPLKNTCYDTNGRKNGREIIFYPKTHLVKQAVTWEDGSCVRIENYDLNGKKHGNEIAYTPESEKVTKWRHGVVVGEIIHKVKK